MVPDLLYRATTSKGGTPVGAAGRGIVGGLAGALLISIVSRMLPVLRTQCLTIPPSRSADAFQPTLTRALTLSQSPGPEGLAEQFAFKVASGVFGRDLSSSARLAGRVIHVVYGSAWACFTVSSRPATLDRPRPLAQSTGSWSGSSDRRSSCRPCGSWDGLQRSRWREASHWSPDTSRTAWLWRPLSRRCSGRSGSGSRGR
jgi:hypothetical protein